MIKREVISTNDGSKTLYIPGMEEHYHSVKGAYTESKHIFIDMGLLKRDKNELHLLEIGFGTGLNAILTLIEAEKRGWRVDYTTVELYPLATDIIDQLDYPTALFPDSGEAYYRLHAAEWNDRVAINEHFTLHKIHNDFTVFSFEGKYDVVYFDAFAPEKQPEMWNQPLFDRLYNCMNEGGILTTYCAKGVVRRMLQAAGFTTERLAGPPNGKREILRATK